MSSTRNDPELRTRRLQQITDDVGERLRRVCGHLAPEEFSALVTEIAHVTLKFEEREFGTPIEADLPPRRGD